MTTTSILNFKNYKEVAKYFEEKFPNCTYVEGEDLVYNIFLKPHELRKSLKKDGWEHYSYAVTRTADNFSLELGDTTIYFDYNYQTQEGQIDWY